MYIYVSMDLTGTDADFPRACALINRINSANEDRLAIAPILLFREAMFKMGKLRTASIGYSIKLMEMCDEVWVYDDPAVCLNCQNDVTFAHGMGKPVVEMYKKNYLEDMQLGEVMAHYQQCLGGFPPRMAVNDIAFYLKKGISSDVIKNAIDVGVRGNKPWGYINAILSRYLKEGIFTMDKLQELNNAKKGGTKGGGIKPTQKYDNVL